MTTILFYSNDMQEKTMVKVSIKYVIEYYILKILHIAYPKLWHTMLNFAIKCGLLNNIAFTII